MENWGENNFFRQILPNGLTVIFEKRNLPAISVNAAVKFGSAYENEKIKGIAHYVEHSVFKGTKKRTQQEISREIEKKGAEWNAFTSEEETVFWIKISSGYFGKAMNILSDIMLNASFKKRLLETERGVILEEIKMYHDLPKIYVQEKLKELLFTKPFGMSIAGTEKIIKKMPVSELKKTHNIFYNPSNIVVSVVGNVNVDEIWNLCQKYFVKNTLKKKIKLTINASEGKFGELIEKRKNLDQAHIALGFHSPKRSENLRYAAEIFNAYLAEGMSSPLFQEIREKRGAAYYISSNLDQGINYGYQTIGVGTMKNKINEIKKIILDEIKKISNLSQKDFEETKEQIIGNYVLQLEDSSKVALKILYEELTGNAKEYYHYPERISAVKLEDVKKLADIKNYAFTAVVPE